MQTLGFDDSNGKFALEDQNQSVPGVASMPSKASTTTTFEVERVIQPIYTGGDVALDKSGRILATCLGEEALITDLNNGDLLVRVEGVGSALQLPQ